MVGSTCWEHSKFFFSKLNSWPEQMYKPPVVEDVDPIEPDVGVVERSSSFSGVLEDSSSVVGSVHSSILLILLYLFFDFNGPIHL